MIDNYIQLEKDNILRLGIKTVEGKETGEHLEFDLEDIEAPLRYQELIEANKRNHTRLKNDLLIISKRQDVKGKKLYSKNQEDELKAYRTFIEKEVEAYNMFLGENGVQKLLNGKKPNLNSFEVIDKLIDEQILPLLEERHDILLNKVKEKYSKFSEMNEKAQQIEVIK